MREEDLRKQWESDNKLCHISMIRITNGSYAGTLAVVVELGEGINEKWKAGDFIAFWADGEHTCLDGLEFDVLVDDLLVEAESDFD